MKTEPLETAMVLAEPISKRLGQMTMKKGSELSPRLVTIKTLGISAALIESGEAEFGDRAMHEKSKRHALSRIKKRLFWHPQNPLEEEIIQLAVQQAFQRSLR